MERTLTPSEVRAFYDRLGPWQDYPAFYDRPAIEALVREGSFATARRVFELGCGTGRLADRLLEEVLPRDARYVAVDLSPKMVAMAALRLRRLGSRAEVRLSDGATRVAAGAAAFDRFLATYVLDLLPEPEIDAVLAEAHRTLQPGGRLCAVALTCGEGAAARLLSQLWRRVHALHPLLVGGCRPIRVAARLAPAAWEVRHDAIVSSFGIASEVLIATRR